MKYLLTLWIAGIPHMHDFDTQKQCEMVRQYAVTHEAYMMRTEDGKQHKKNTIADSSCIMLPAEIDVTSSAPYTSGSWGYIGSAPAKPLPINTDNGPSAAVPMTIVDDSHSEGVISLSGSQKLSTIPNYVSLLSTEAISKCPDYSAEGQGVCNTAYGWEAGITLTKGSNNVLIGPYTNTPLPDTNNFVNIDNKFCFDRKSGKKLKCPDSKANDVYGDSNGK